MSTNNATDPKRTWSEIAKEYNATSVQRAALSSAIRCLQWEAVEPGGRWPFSQGYAIKAAIEHFNIPQVSQVAHNGVVSLVSKDPEGGPYGLYGIEGTYSNGRVRVYLLDRGIDVLVIASDFYGDAE